MLDGMCAVRRDAAPDQRTIALWIALALAALIAWGSFFPFEFIWPDAAMLRHRLLRALSQHATRSDLVANFLLYIPFGAMCVLTSADASPWRRIFRSTAWGAALSGSIEITQLFTLHRITSIIDLGLNSLGSFLGAGLTLAYLAVGDRWLARGIGRARPAVIPMGLVLLWLTADFAPYVPRFHLAQVSESLNGFWQQGWSWQHVLVTFGAWCMVSECARRMFRLQHALAMLVILLAATVAARLLVISQHLAPQEVFAWSAVSFAIALTMGLRNDARAKLVFYAGMSAMLAHELLPWEFSAEAQPFLWVPFSGSLLSGRNYQPLLEKIFLYSAVLWTFLVYRRSDWRAVLHLMIVVAAIETVQIWMPGKEPEVTDVLLVATAGAAFWLLRRAQPYALGLDSMSISTARGGRLEGKW
jgi:VanZ family protein